MQFSRHKHWLILLFIALIGGGVPTLGKIALQEIPTYSFTFLRFLLAALCFLPLYLKHRTPIGKHGKRIIFVSLFAMGNVLFFALGVQHTSASVVQAIYTLSPIIAALVSYRVLAERFSWRKISGIGLGFLGALTIIFLPFLQESIGLEVSLSGNLLIVIATISVSLFTVYSKTLAKEFQPVEITFFFSLVTMFVMGIFSVYEAVIIPQWWQAVSTDALFGLAYVGIFGTALYYLMMQELIKRASPVIATMVLYIQPFAAMLWASVLLDEQMSLLFVAAVCVVLGGVWLTVSERTQQ